jgi:hypothetical protein
MVMDRLCKVLFVGYLMTTLFVMIAQFRMPQPTEPGLLIPDDAIPLTQGDFASGSYRIQMPGYYYFAEDVFFNPDQNLEALRTDKPQIGAWFAALSIECDNVVIDLNTKTFAADPAFLESQKLKVFALIELGNAPFPLAKFPFFAYSGELEPLVASNVVIKNGTIGSSPHHGIHGNNNSNVQVYNMIFRDWEVAGIAFNGLKSGAIRNVTITGLEHAMDFTGLVSVMLAVKVVLEDLRDNYGDTNAQKYIDALQPLIDNPHVNGSIRPTRLNYGNVYGIFLNRAFDIGPVAQSVTQSYSNAIIIENVLIANITSELLETVAIGNAQGQTMMAELFGTFRWEDAYPRAVFEPNALLKAQVYVQNVRAPQKMPAGFADNILSDTPSEALFLLQARPVFGLDFPGHANKGIFGIRVDAGYGVSIQNCSIMGLNNLGPIGRGLGDIPAGNEYSFVPNRYAGNDVFGISLAVCRNCSVVNCDISECVSSNGNVYGIAVRNEASANLIDSCTICNMSAQRDDLGSVINPASEVYGIFIGTSAVSTRVINCVQKVCTAPRYAYGMYVHNSADTYITNCYTSNVSATVAASPAQKQACGCATIASYGTNIENCIVRDIRCDGEEDAQIRSGSRAISFWLGDTTDQTDYYAVVTNCIAENGNGGAGTSAGIRIENADSATITHNQLAYHTTNTVQQGGYGIFRSPSNPQTGLVLQNNAYGNSRKNYEPSGAAWAIFTIEASDTGNAVNGTEFDNISIVV